MPNPYSKLKRWLFSPEKRLLSWKDSFSAYKRKSIIGSYWLGRLSQLILDQNLGQCVLPYCTDSGVKTQERGQVYFFEYYFTLFKSTLGDWWTGLSLVQHVLPVGHSEKVELYFGQRRWAPLPQKLSYSIPHHPWLRRPGAYLPYLRGPLDQQSVSWVRVPSLPDTWSWSRKCPENTQKIN